MQGCLQGWRLRGAWQVPLVVPVLRRAAGTGEGTAAVSTSRISWSLAGERGQGSTGSIAWRLRPLRARALCHVSLAPAFLGLRCFSAVSVLVQWGKPSICRINRIREVSAGSLPWGAVSRSCVAGFKPSSLPAAGAEDPPPAPARPRWAPSSPAETSRGRESLRPGLPLVEVLIPHPVVAASSPVTAEAPRAPCTSQVLVGSGKASGKG